MSAGVLNALSWYGDMNRSNSVRDSIQHPATVNPLQDIMSAAQTAATLKYLRNPQAQTPPQTAMRGSIDLFGNTPAASNANALNAGGAGTSAAPAATSSAATPATTSTPSPAWFMPRGNTTNQGNSVYTGPGGQKYLDTSPGTLPYSGWQGGGGNNSTPSTGPSWADPNQWRDSSQSSLNGAVNSILNDPSDAGVHTAMTGLYGTYGRAADFARNDLLGMSTDQRRAWAQQQLSNMNASTAGTTNVG